MTIRLLTAKTIAGHRYGAGTVLDLKNNVEEATLVDAAEATWFPGEEEGVLSRAANLADLPDKAVARDNLGLGSLATQGPAGAILDGAGAKLELGSTMVPNAPYIDFRSSGLNSDHDSRIYASGGSAAFGQGTLRYIAVGGHRFGGPVNPNANGGSSLGTDDLRWSTLNTHTIPGGTGTLALTTYTTPGGLQRLTSDKLAEMVSVRDFGAIGNGVADDTAAFQAAASAAPGYSNVEKGPDVPKPLNADVYVPAGSYVLNSKIKTQKRITWHFADGAKVSDSTRLDGVIARGSRTNAIHMNIGGNACTGSFRANRIDLDKNPEVYGIGNQASVSVHGPLHTVALFADNIGTTCATLTGTTFTATSVTFTNELDFADFKIGSALTAGTGPGLKTGFAESWNESTKTIYVKGWYKFTGTEGVQETPANGALVRINYFGKIWAHNANVTLPSGADTIQAAGFELGTLNYQADVPEVFDVTGRYLWGYDAVNIGPYTSSTAFIARNKFVEGFLSKGPKYAFRVFPPSDPAKDLTAVGFSYEQESGTGFRCTVGGKESFRVRYDGVMELGRRDIAHTPYIDFHSSGTENDYDARIQVTGGSSTIEQGTIQYLAAAHTFKGAVRPIDSGVANLGTDSYRWKSLNSHAIPPGTGTLALKNDLPFLNLKDFGGVGDGVTNNFQAITNAMAAAAGRKIFVPRDVAGGKYAVTSGTLTLTGVFEYETGATIYASGSGTVTDKSRFIGFGGGTVAGEQGRDRGTYGLNVQLRGPIPGPIPVADVMYNFIYIPDDQMEMTGPQKAVHGLYTDLRFGGTKASGARHGVSARLLQNAPTNSSNPNRNYVGVLGQIATSTGDNGIAGTPLGAYFGGNFYARIDGTAQHVHNVTAAEFNSGILAGGSCAKRTGIQVGMLGDERGYEIDAGIAILNLSIATATLKNGIRIGPWGSATNDTLGADSTAIEINQAGSIANGVVFNCPITGSILEGGNVKLTSTSLSMGGTKVIGVRDTGWAAMTGTEDKTTVYDASTITLTQLAERVAAMQAALTVHGLIGV